MGGQGLKEVGRLRRPSPAPSAWRALSARVGLHRAGRWLESKIRMARQPPGHGAGPGVQALPHARPPLLGAGGGGSATGGEPRTRGGGGIREVEGRAKDGTGGCGGRARREQWRASDRSSPPPRASIYLYRGHPLPGTPAAYVTERYHQRDRPTDRPPAEAAGCRGRRTSTSTSCARSRATTSPPPPSSATTAPSGLRAPPSRR